MLLGIINITAYILESNTEDYSMAGGIDHLSAL